MSADLPPSGRVTLRVDKAMTRRVLSPRSRRLGVTPHVAQYDTRRRSAVDRRTSRHAGYALSQVCRTRIEEMFGWVKTAGGLRKTRHRGTQRVGWMFTFVAAAYNLVRLPPLLADQA